MVVERNKSSAQRWACLHPERPFCAAQALPQRLVIRIANEVNRVRCTEPRLRVGLV